MTIPGWIKLHRKLLESRVFSDADTLRLFLWILLKANHKLGYFEMNEILPGQLATSVNRIMEELEWTRAKVRYKLTQLKNSGCITVITTNKFTLISVVNWETYQDQSDESQPSNDHPATIEQPSSSHPATIQQPQSKNDKNNKNEKNAENAKNSLTPADAGSPSGNDYPDEFEAWWSIWPSGRKLKKSQSHQKWKKAVTKLTKVRGSPEAARDWLNDRTRAFISSPSGAAAGDYCPHPTTWLSQERYDDAPESWNRTNGSTINTSSGVVSAADRGKF